jgi:hypothetical protein
VKRPSLQFYPDNWRNNANLRRCSWAARGVWVEVICLMHDSDRYGVLEWPLKEIAQALGCTAAPLKELVEKGVLKGCDKGDCDPFVYVPRSGRKDGAPVTLVDVQTGPIWFSSRMLKDEYKRIVRGDGDGNGDAPKATPKPTPKAAPNPPIDAAPNPGIGPYAGAPPPSSPSPASPGIQASIEALLPAEPPACPQQKLLALFAELIPELPQPRRELWDGSKGSDAMRQRWKWLMTATRDDTGARYATTAAEGIDWMSKFFARVASSDFLTGRNGKWRNCDLTWLMGKENFAKVVQGNYSKETA